MSDLLMDFDTNDVDITNGDLSMATGDTAIQENLQQALQLWLGEWFLVTDAGVPYRQHVFVKNPNLDIIQSDLISTSLDVPGVVEILDLSFDYDSTRRTLSVEMSVRTSNGQTISVQPQINTPVNGTIQGTPA